MTPARDPKQVRFTVVAVAAIVAVDVEIAAAIVAGDVEIAKPQQSSPLPQ